MIAVIFEVEPKEGHRDAYLEIAAQLKSSLSNIDGFVSIERFQSLVDPNKVLSLSFWRDEAAIAAWRALPEHRSAQDAGRNVHFKNYRLRVAGVDRDYGMHERAQTPDDSKAIHDTNH
mgnify:CR=1 FL=1